MSTWHAVSIAGDDSSSWNIFAHSVLVVVVFAEIFLLRATDGTNERDSRLVGVIDVHQSLSNSVRELVFEDGLNGAFGSTAPVDDDPLGLCSAVSRDELADEMGKGGFEGLVVDDSEAGILVVDAVNVLSATLSS